MSNFANIGKRIIELTSCHSTNDYALDLITKSEAQAGDIVYAKNQMGGRGQKGNIWLAPKGENLTFSLILTPSFLRPAYQFELTVFISIALIRYLKSKAIEAEIKWPNDIYVEGKKIGGILIENKIKGSKLGFSIVGIGLNVNQTDFGMLNATSLQLVNHQKYSVYEELFNTFKYMNDVYDSLKRGEDIRKEYMRYLIGTDHEILFDDGEQFLSKVVNVDDFGALELDKNGIIKKYGIQDVKFVKL